MNRAGACAPWADLGQARCEACPDDTDCVDSRCAPAAYFEGGPCGPCRGEDCGGDECDRYLYCTSQRRCAPVALPGAACDPPPDAAPFQKECYLRTPCDRNTHRCPPDECAPSDGEI